VVDASSAAVYHRWNASENAGGKVLKSDRPGDTVELQTCTGTLDLTPGMYLLKINTGL
jgi:hypothetical protein